jgi:hypothetical protein
VASFFSSLRYLLADFIGDDDAAPPFLPEGLPDSAVADVSDGIHLLIDYQGPSYAQLYVDRIRRFIGRKDVDEAMLGEIARLMAQRMSYQDPIRIAQLKLNELEAAPGDLPRAPADMIGKFRLDELIGALPAAVAEPVLDALEWAGWTHMPVSIRFSARSRWGIRRLKIEASLRRWRLFSVRYTKERAWVERWLHMISRSLDHDRRLRRPLSPRSRRLARHYRRPGETVLRRRAAPGRSRRGRGRGARRRRARCAPGRAQARDRGDPGAGAGRRHACRGGVIFLRRPRVRARACTHL